MSFEFLGIGIAVPDHFIDQGDAAELATTLTGPPEERLRLRALYRKTRVKQRRSVLLEGSTNGDPATQRFYPAAESHSECGPTTAIRMQRYEAEASRLASTAATRAIAEAGLGSDELTHLITVSCSGFSAPGVDVDLMEQLGLSRDIARTHVGFMGCHGAMNGLRVARAMVDADAAARVLLCSVELCSLHQQYGKVADHVIANSLFADGASAVVGQVGSVAGEAWRLAASGSSVIPGTKDLMHWHIRDNGFEMALSPEVPEVIRAHLTGWITQWLVKQGLAITDVGSWAVHPGGPKILQACSESLGLSEEDMAPSWEVLSDYGNMSSPTVLFILQRLRERAAPLPCVALAFGPGLTIEAALFR